MDSGLDICLIIPSQAYKMNCICLNIILFISNPTGYLDYNMSRKNIISSKSNFLIAKLSQGFQMKTVLYATLSYILGSIIEHYILFVEFYVYSCSINSFNS